MTGGEMETYLFERIKTLAPPISGKVYYRGTRPVQNDRNTGTEDCVVAVTTGTGLQIEKGTCVVNIYIPDIRVASGMFIYDKSRCDAVGRWLDTLPDTLTAMGDVKFERNSMVLTLPEENLKEHFVSLKMDFKLLET